MVCNWNDDRGVDRGVELRSQALKLSLADFTNLFKHPFLVVGGFPLHWGSIREARRFETSDTTLKPPSDEVRALIAEAVQSLRGFYPVTHSPRSPAYDRISIGRKRVNDIVFDTRYVSKFHAHLLQVQEKVHDKVYDFWELADNGSTNGTFHNGTKLRSNERVRLQYGDTLRFGYVEAQFESTERIYAGLRGG